MVGQEDIWCPWCDGQTPNIRTKGVPGGMIWVDGCQLVMTSPIYDKQGAVIGRKTWFETWCATCFRSKNFEELCFSKK